jgi:hypothetical protein
MHWPHACVCTPTYARFVNFVFLQSVKPTRGSDVKTEMLAVDVLPKPDGWDLICPPIWSWFKTLLFKAWKIWFKLHMCLKMHASDLWTYHPKESNGQKKVQQNKVLSTWHGGNWCWRSETKCNMHMLPWNVSLSVLQFIFYFPEGKKDTAFKLCLWTAQ